MINELKYTLILLVIFLLSGYIFHKIKSREIKNIEVPHFLSRIASILGLVIIISFALGITMAVITIVKLLG
jgi:phosphatidylserine synthase